MYPASMSRALSRRSVGLLAAVLLTGVTAGSIVGHNLINLRGADSGAGSQPPTAGQTGAASARPSTAAPIGAAVASPSVSPSASAAPTAAPPLLDPQPIPALALQTRLDQIRSKYQVPGVSVTIIWPDGRVWTGVSGVADLKTKRPVVAGTAFAVGSVSKTFLAATILELVDEGRLALTDTVRHWLPTARISSKATIAELLDHTSGVYDFFSNHAIDTAILAHPLQHWTVARSLSYVRSPYCMPGKCWAYSNTGYVLLGQIVQKVTGHAVAVEERTRFMTPLGLRRTFIQGVEARRGTVATNYSMLGPFAHLVRTSLSDGSGINPFTSVVTAAGYAGAIASSSRDLAVWARALYAGSLLDPGTQAAMLDVSRSVAVGSKLPYGLGVMDMTLGGRFTVGHDGRLIGARASIRFLPETGFTIAVTTNQERIGPDTFGTSLMNIAVASLTPPPPPPAP